MNDQTKIIEEYKGKIKNRKTAIRAFCVECMGGYIAEVAKCPSVKCALYPFRMGKDPYTTRKGPTKKGE